MINESLISLPSNLEDPIVLRRTLSAIIEQLDIAVGKRTGVNSLFTNQNQLLAESKNIESSVISSRDSLAEINELVADNLLAIEEIKNDLSGVQSDLLASSVKFSFIGRVDNGPVVLSNSTLVSNGRRTAEGVYLFDHESTVLADSLFCSNKEISVTFNDSTITVTMQADLTNRIDIVGLYAPN